MEKLDLKKVERTLYAPTNRTWELVEVPPALYVMIDGTGNPNTSQSYIDAVQALYAVSYALKFASKAEDRDFVVMPLEAQWYAEDYSTYQEGRKDEFQWTVMIRQPEWISSMNFNAAIEHAQEKYPIPEVRLSATHEGLCAQMLHIGPYYAEGPILAELHERWMPENGLEFNGLHHEIYLNDPRRVEPEQLKTILRQPVKFSDS